MTPGARLPAVATLTCGGDERGAPPRPAAWHLLPAWLGRKLSTGGSELAPGACWCPGVAGRGTAAAGGGAGRAPGSGRPRPRPRPRLPGRCVWASPLGEKSLGHGSLGACGARKLCSPPPPPALRKHASPPRAPRPGLIRWHLAGTAGAGATGENTQPWEGSPGTGEVAPGGGLVTVLTTTHPDTDGARILGESPPRGAHLGPGLAHGRSDS